MKRLIICSMFILFSSSAIATTPAELCETFADIAKLSITARQANLPAARPPKSGIPVMDDVVASIIQDAHKAPIMETEAGRKKAIELFTRRIRNECLVTFGS